MTTSEGASLRKLGEVRPGITYTGTTAKDYVDPSPIVLWAGAKPAAVLHLSVESRWRHAVQQVAPVDPAVKLPGFPVVYRSVTPEDGSAEDVDGLDGVVLADLDGDGVQELVLLKEHGGVDVHALRGPLATYPSPAAPRGSTYQHFLAQVLHLGGRDVVYVLSRRSAQAVEDRNLLLRVDGKGITRVRLEGLERKEILALGEVQRKGSPDVDELLALVEDGRADVALARFRPDGKAIGAARRLYVRPSSSYSAFRFVPGSSSAVLMVKGGVLVITPEKPVNWIREIKVLAKVPPDDPGFLFVTDADTDPKLVHRVGDALWAVNGDGTCFKPSGGGAWAALAKPGPYLTLPVPAGEKLWFVWEAEGGRLFATSSREKGTRPLTHDEWRSAADRYLPPAEAEAFRRSLEPSLDGKDYFRDMEMQDERERRKVEPEQVRTVEDWKRLLPRSFASVAENHVTDHDLNVGARLRELRQNPGPDGHLPDPAGLRAFVDGLEVPARTTFMLVEGTAVSSASAPGSPMRLLETQVAGPVEYRIHEGKLTAVVALQAVDAEGKAAPAFYLVEASFAARR